MSNPNRINLSNGQWCSVRPMTWSLGAGWNDQVCPMCKQPIVKGNEVFLLINNWTLFPNRVMHQACQLDTLESTIIWIQFDWMQAQQYKHWFE